MSGCLTTPYTEKPVTRLLSSAAALMKAQKFLMWRLLRVWGVSGLHFVSPNSTLHFDTHLSVNALCTLKIFCIYTRSMRLGTLLIHCFKYRMFPIILAGLFCFRVWIFSALPPVLPAFPVHVLFFRNSVVICLSRRSRHVDLIFLTRADFLFRPLLPSFSLFLRLTRITELNLQKLRLFCPKHQIWQVAFKHKSTLPTECKIGPAL